MSLSERLAKEAPSKRVTFTEWVISLPPKEREALEVLAHPDSGYSSAQILGWIGDEGGPGSADTALRKYRESLR